MSFIVDRSIARAVTRRLAYKKRRIKESFSISDYGVISFDLDNTLVVYNLIPLFSLMYKLLKESMESKDYPGSLFPKKMTEKELNLIQRGLFMEFETGRVLKLGPEGEVIGGYNGEGEVTFWGSSWVEDPLGAYKEGQAARATLDFTDGPLVVLYSIASKYKNGTTAWEDIEASMKQIYTIGNESYVYDRACEIGLGAFVRKCTVLNWIEGLRRDGKKVVLVTGSPERAADLVATEALGRGWEKTFDALVFSAKKPDFFGYQRPFLEQFNKGCTKAFTGGSWTSLIKQMGWTDLDSLYVGDSLIQDVVAPCRAGLDVAAVVPELNPDHPFANSTFWGPPLVPGTPAKGDTLWGRLLRDHSTTIVPSVQALASIGFRRISKGYM